MSKKRNIEPKKNHKLNNRISNIKKEFDDVDLAEDVFQKSSFSIFEVSIITLIAILFGIIIGYFINYSKDVDKNLGQIITTYEKIVSNYYGDIDENKLSNSAIKGMIDSLGDPYSNYMDGDTAKNFNQMIDGEYIGIGVVVSHCDEGGVVTEVMENSPSAKAGIKIDDIIIKVDDIDVTDSLGDDLITLIQGKEGTKVKITVKRGEENLSFDIKRSKISLSSVTSDIYASGDAYVGYIKIDVFASNTASQFSAALKNIEKEKIDALIIDVRNNPGGHLVQTRKILSNFFDKQTVLYQIESKGKKKKVYSLSNEKRTYPIAVLINESSASAAEVLASCFKDNYKNAIIVGENSYGKGTIQKSEKLNNGSSIKYTTDRWLTAKGKSLNEKGVKPDYNVDLDDNSSLGFEDDDQLQTSLSKIGNINEIKAIE